MNNFRLLISLIIVLLASGCASLPPAHDYSEFRNYDPRSILILPPINNSPEVLAPYSVMAQTALPIAESGF